MRDRVRNIFLIFILVLGILTPTFVFAFPEATNCATILLRQDKLESFGNGVLFEKSISTTERMAFLKTVMQSRERISQQFGQPIAQPIIVQLRDPNALTPFKSNLYASSLFVGSRTCMIVGPKGANIDVVSHELMHAELHHRLGWWRSLIDLPSWFDEGVAMQVDFRPRYQLSKQEVVKGETHAVRELRSANQFQHGNDQELTFHYAAAKAEVATWLSSLGNQNLYTSLERLRAGESFDTVVGK